MALLLCYACDVCRLLSFFFFEQKTAYEMRISDWSSDVCSSDLSTHPNVLGVNEWDGKPARVIAAEARPTNGANSVADPRVAQMHSGGLGVHAYDDTTGVLGGRSGPTNGAYAVADIRVDGHPKSVQLGVRGMEQPAPVVKGDMSVGTGPYAVADPSLGRVAHSNVYRVVPFDNTGIAVTSSDRKSTRLNSSH